MSRIVSAFAALVAALSAALVAAALAAPGASAQMSLANPPAGANDFACRPTLAHPDPVVLVHGLSATMGENWGYLSPQLKARGYCVFALTYGIDRRAPWFGGVIPIERSAPELGAFVDRVLAETGAQKVDLVGHSEGTFMPEYWLKYLGGASKVNRYVAMTPLYKGTNLAMLGTLSGLGAGTGAPQAIAGLVAGLCGSCPEFLAGSSMVGKLNAGGGGAAVPGVTYTTIPTRFDELVEPYTSGILRAANVTNHVLQDVCPNDISEHAAEASDPVVAQLVFNALDPGHEQPVSCAGLPPLVPGQAAGGPAGSGAGVPVPDRDPFYAVPAGISALRNGSVLASRPITALAGPVPLPARAWEVKYKTTDNQGAPTATVLTVMVPKIPWTGHGPRPLVSYQTAEDGVGTKCSPSYALHAGLGASNSNSEPETIEMALALARGWAVAAPDYEGPHSAFLGAPGEAHGVLDGLRAALRFKPAGLGAHTPAALWGYSGGAYASSVAAQAQPSYAPELKLAGVALGGVPGSVRAELTAFSGSFAGGAIMVGIVGIDRAFPAAHVLSYLNARGHRLAAASQTDCITDAAVRSPFLSVTSIEASPGVMDSPAVAALLRSTSPISFGAPPSAPIYDYHAVFDELAPIGPDRALVRRYCAGGVRVQHIEDLAGEHLSELATGTPGALAYMADRFAGRPAPSNCA
jgi:hypothetical protein